MSSRRRPGWACAGSTATAWTALSCQLIVSKSASVQTVLATAGPVLILRLAARAPGEPAGARGGPCASQGEEVRPAGHPPPPPGVTDHPLAHLQAGAARDVA